MPGLSVHPMEEGWRVPNSSIMVFAATPRVGGNPLAFYSAAATVIPLLYVALVYQARLFERATQPRPARFWYAYAAAFIVATGELTAFHVLSTEHPTPGQKHLVADVLLILGVSLLVQPVAGAAEDRTGGTRSASAWYAMAAINAVLGIVLIHVA